MQTGAPSDDLAETHPAEGMTKVIPALSCKHDNEPTKWFRRCSSTHAAATAARRIQSLRAFRRANNAGLISSFFGAKSFLEAAKMVPGGPK